METERATTLLYEARRGNELAASETARGLAVLGPFDPARLEGSTESEEVLALLCRPLPPRDGRRESLLRDARRVDVLARILREGGRDGLARTRKAVAQDLDSPLQRMLDAFVLDVDVPVDARGEDELIASLDVYRWATEAVARAGLTKSIPVQPGRDAIEGRLALLEVTRPVRRLVAGGCVGRERELALLHAYRSAQPQGRGLAEEPAMVVFGIGGVGKSTLVAQFVKDLFEQGDGAPQAWAYVDFDRPTLASYAPGVVLTDIVRQVAAQFPEQRRLLERSEVVEAQRNLGAGLEALDERSSLGRAGEFAHALQSFGHDTLVVVLDTFEEVEREAPQQAEQISRVFAGLAGELPGLKLIVSGRSPAAAFDSDPQRERRMAILPLGEDAALVLLRHFVTAEAERADRSPPALDDDLGREVVELVGGIPLTLRLAADVLVHEGAGAVEDAANRGRAIARVREELVRGFLYHRILDHISVDHPAKTRELRRVAKASIALRWVTAELVEEVLLPAIGDGGRLPAGELFEALVRDVAFVERDGAQLRLREDLRGPALAALRNEDGSLVRLVHTRAAAYFGKRSDDERAALEQAYHRLALGEPIAVVAADLGDAVVRRLEPAVGDLPDASAADIGRALRDTGAAAHASDLVTWEREVLPEAEAALQSGDLVRARALLSKKPARSAGTELHRLTSRLLEAEGNPRAAAVAARRDLYASAAASDPLRYAATAVRLAGLQESGARPKEADATLRDAVAAPVLSGFPELRLELLLNRMAMRDRLRLDTEDSRWSLGLEARAMLQRLDPASANLNTALVRLLAATLGRDEPQRVRAAARLLGFGRGESPVLVEEVVRAIAAWDADGPEPGRLASALGLKTGPDPESLMRAWRARLAGMGTDAAPLLDRLWEYEKPPEPVREALRNVYVWWGMKPAPPDEPGPLPEHHFLADVPLDWSRRETVALEELVLTAYPTSTETLSLADRAGLDMSRIAWSQTDRSIARELLTVAGRAGNVDELVAAMLDDKAAVSIHGPLRKLVGEDWLASRLE